MAGIDKTYVNTWEDYKQIREWAINTDMIYPNGINGGKMIKWFYYPNLSEENFKDNKEIALWNTSESVDMFLYKNCPFDLVQNRLKEQYGDVSYLDRESIDEHEVGNHFKLPDWYIKCSYYTVDVIYNNTYWRYSEKYNIWVSPKEFGPYGGTCTIFMTSDKALARKIRKWNLPKGAILNFECIKYIHDFTITIRK